MEPALPIAVTLYLISRVCRSVKSLVGVMISRLCFRLRVRQIICRGYWLSAVPSALTLVMIAMAMPAAINAYSIAVAAAASFRNLASKFNVASCALFFCW